jgi:hypothetical protein
LRRRLSRDELPFDFHVGDEAFLSVNVLLDVMLTWYVPLFASILVVRTEQDIIILMKIIAVAGIVVSLAEVIEFTTNHKPYFEILPRSVLDAMLDANELANDIFNGIYFCT